MFCRQHAAIARSPAPPDSSAHEFGAAYFRSPHWCASPTPSTSNWRPRVQGVDIELGGHQIAILPENAVPSAAGITNSHTNCANLHTDMLFHRAEMACFRAPEEVLVVFPPRALPRCDRHRESLAHFFAPHLPDDLVAAEFTFLLPERSPKGAGDLLR